ncbi:hypothetical protein CSC70_10700 [Pseudoxanthomonas kalamensis DSM 18571]|uniref:DUF3301 domain-containing protein n=1 Tax=Pseudoxanthomonas kalamensis TaxID=289483 RepID=UPI0013918625|nr:DUF3301 domain-containing protein [Pseudoxanthomonas kalamensis]KAF1709276.1 hypothetical protein CSC70_10700 [Pseudoxanthomonas kalamensis DSM 18571]
MSPPATIGLMIAAAAAYAWWNSARAAAERAGLLGRNACTAAGVIWLDESVHATGIRLRRGDDGRLGLERSFRFEYSRDGADRHSGKLVLHGDRLVSFIGPVTPSVTRIDLH